MRMSLHGAKSYTLTDSLGDFLWMVAFYAIAHCVHLDAVLLSRGHVLYKSLLLIH